MIRGYFSKGKFIFCFCYPPPPLNLTRAHLKYWFLITNYIGASCRGLQITGSWVTDHCVVGYRSLGRGLHITGSWVTDHWVVGYRSLGRGLQITGSWATDHWVVGYRSLGRQITGSSDHWVVGSPPVCVWSLVITHHSCPICDLRHHHITCTNV